MTQERLGLVVGGSLTRGLEIKLDPGVSIENMAVGRYIVLQGERRRFLAMVTDVSLGAMDPALALAPPEVSDPFFAEVMRGTATYGKLQVMPMLAIGGDVAALPAGPQPVKTVPAHFAEAYAASQADMELVFGPEDERRMVIGSPLDMEVKVCLDLERLAERSTGVFGKTGTGKTYLTLLLLAGLIQKGKAVNLVFDMHNDYGWQVSAEHGRRAKGLKQLFSSQVAVFTLDEESSRRRGISPDFVVELGYDEIEPEDMALLAEALNLTPLAVDAVYALARRFGRSRWLKWLLEEGEGQTPETLASLNIAEGTFQALTRRLERLRRLPFLVEKAARPALPELLQYLESGRHVVLEFGRYDRDDVAHILVANVLARRIHDRWRARCEAARGGGGSEPPILVLTLEEAHKLLSPQVARQTIFGTIAREMRKFRVTLLVVDQRPSGIDGEIMSQLATRLLCLLDSEEDIEAALAGVPGKGELRTVLSRLESRQQALLLGHALPVPVVVRTRDYDEEFYRSLGPARRAGGGPPEPEVTIEELFPE
ncbi:MAG: ATP-binding protein [Chloroflexi bacterium]|nr:ATP-binding protein [Chloroflexota bacterium]